MKVVWKLDKATVRDVYEELREKRAIAYTTVMTLLMMSNTHTVNESLIPTRNYELMRDFVDRVFDGAASGLLLHLAKDGRLSKDERQHIRRIIEDIED